ncbi:MAG: NAD(P)/FAD-dependent oxidoreductase [Patescibacteria group bacterium]
MDNKKNKKIDVVVVGGGPAGMMAAGRAGECLMKDKKESHSVLLLEKNKTLGKKLLLTGGGRCNITNNIFDIRAMLAKYKGSGQFLFSAFSQFGVKDALKFFNELSVATKEEAEGRVFPVSNKAQSVLDALIKYMKENEAETQTGAAVADISIDNLTKNFSLKLKDKTEIMAKSCIIATGGISRPETGSTGEGFNWLKKLGHTIIDNDFALVPIALKDEWAKKLSGLTLKDIKLTIFKNGHKYLAQKGKLLFTHFGISGPTVLDMSKDIGELIKYSKDPEYSKGSEDVIALDLLPKLDHGALKQRLQVLLVAESNKKLKNTLSRIIHSALVPAMLEIANINGETANHGIRSEERARLVALMKDVPLHIKGLLGPDKAIVSSGGVALKEIDFKTMQSRLIPNLYVVGDALNVNRPSGGYSLQLCWTTGFIAGNTASKAAFN